MIFDKVVGINVKKVFESFLKHTFDDDSKYVITITESNRKGIFYKEASEGNHICHIKIKLPFQDDKDFQELVKAAHDYVNDKTSDYSNIPIILSKANSTSKAIFKCLLYNNEFVVVCLLYCNDESDKFVGIYVQRFSFHETKPCQEFFKKYSKSSGWKHDIIDYFGKLRATRPVHEEFWDWDFSTENTECRICKKPILH